MVGREWIIDAIGCREDLLSDRESLEAVLDRVIADLNLHVVGEGHWHQFPGAGGWTVLFLLTESHLSCHTYPETGIATFNLYCCNERAPWTWQQSLSELLQAKEVVVRSFDRGTSGEKS